MKISNSFILIVCIILLSILFLTCKNVTQIESLMLEKGGTFQTGDQFDEGKPLEKLLPLHRVQLNDFYTANYEMDPVTCISCEDAIHYRNWLNQKDGLSPVCAHTKNIYAAYCIESQQINHKLHYSQPWKVHEIAPDFDLLDVWEYPISADISKGQDFFFFLKMMRQPSQQNINDFTSAKHLAATFLISLRMYLGEIFGLDKNMNTLPIPGCQEISIKDRLSVTEQKRSLDLPELKISDDEINTWRIVYLYENEMLIELSIAPVHALMHLGWIQKSENLFTAQLAVYAKPRGKLGHLYMKLIMPFRRLIIYPSLMENVKNIWDAYNKKNPVN